MAKIVSNITGVEWERQKRISWEDIIDHNAITKIDLISNLNALNKGAKVKIVDMRGRINPQYKIIDFRGRHWFVSTNDVIIEGKEENV